MSKKVKKPKSTIEKARMWKRAEIGITAAKFAMPFIPFFTILGINWNEWVGDSSSEGWSIGLGFGMLILATAMAIIGIWKKDELINSKISGVLYIAIVFLIIGFAFQLMASIMTEMGTMFLYVAIGLGASFATDQVDKLAIRPKAVFYAELADKYGLVKESVQKQEDEEQARIEGEMAKQERAKYVPHD